jgi:ferredoxin
MKAVVDPNACVGCGLCVDTCPEVFEMDAAIAKVIADPVPEKAKAKCKDAAEACPVEAIKIVE